MKRLDGQAAIVTGAGRGIGRAVALKLAGEGAAVIVSELDEQPGAGTVELIEASGGQAHLLTGDVTEPNFSERLVDEAIDRFGRIDILVNNAGAIWNTTILKATDDQWYSMMDLHASAVFRILRAAGRYFREVAKSADGDVPRRVVNISSLSGLDGAATEVSYSAAKGAVLALTRSLAKEWGRYGVRVNCVAFGLIDTRLTQAADSPVSIELMGREMKAGIDPPTRNMIAALTPLGRAGTVEEAAGAVYLLCIPESDYITGEVLVCSGGLRM
jgi:3-oxoacyl-[acyl-carrier protein] reductase